jgi:hypothetical protein
VRTPVEQHKKPKLSEQFFSYNWLIATNVFSYGLMKG